MRLRQDAIWREADGEVVGLDGTNTNYVSANAAGSTIWKALVGGSTRSELIDLLVTTFGIDEATAAKDVDAFVAELDASDLLER